MKIKVTFHETKTVVSLLQESDYEAKVLELLEENMTVSLQKNYNLPGYQQRDLESVSIVLKPNRMEPVSSSPPLP